MANLYPGFELVFANETTKKLPDSIITRLATDLGKGLPGGVASYDDVTAALLLKAAITVTDQLRIDVDSKAEASALGTAQATLVSQGAAITALTADRSLKSVTRAVIKQVGSAYPLPLPTGYAGLEFVGTLDPATQAGITLSDYDEWISPT